MRLSWLTLLESDELEQSEVISVAPVSCCSIHRLSPGRLAFTLYPAAESWAPPPSQWPEMVADWICNCRTFVPGVSFVNMVLLITISS